MSAIGNFETQCDNWNLFPPNIAGQFSPGSIPTLVAVGAEDIATPIVDGQRIADAIRGSSFKIINKAGHSSTVEQPDAVNDEIETFLGSLR